jgi:hypothetical protein
VSLRDRLEAKQRRRIDVPILVSDPTQDQANATALVTALQAALGRNDTGEAERLREQIQAQAEKIKEHWVVVELQAMPRDEWRAATGAWQTVETTEDGPQVVTDWAQALAPLLAESCVDPDLRDEAWWAERLARPEWSEGDTNALQLALLQLNVDAVDPQVPKG